MAESHPERFLSLPSLRHAFALLILCSLPIAGCRAQSAGPALTPQQDRRIELTVRSQLGVPPNWSIAPGPRSPSEVPGFDTVRVEFYPTDHPAQKQSLDFLLSKDGKTLERISKYSLDDIPGLNIPTNGRPVRGNKDAKVEIVNFDDLECPYCARMHAELFPETLDHYKGLIKIVYKDDPLTEIHPWALHAAVDADCLADQNGQAYWNYVDYLHTHGEDITGPDRDAAKSDAMLDKLAREEGARGKLNAAALDSCVTKQDATAVHASMQEAEALKVDGTPALFINGERVSGAQPVPYLWAAIDRALRAQGITPPPEPASKPEAATKPGAGGAQ